MNYGFVINNQTCIGCHACSVACKSENEVPLGVNRTWVKYTEKGTFPNTTRSFQVTRCNHCANPPCVRICPVTAMYQRHDGIVEFDPEICIGCKACMQACPYDAIYIDPETHSAAKCHYCSHRTDIGLEPACVVVCPTHSIIAGDLADPLSEISQLVTREKVTVRKPEQGTAPKLFYIEGDDVALTPTAAQASFMWADQVSEQAIGSRTNGYQAEVIPLKAAHSGTAIRAPQTQGSGDIGPIHIGEGRLAEQMVQTTYNAQHHVPWHWPVPAYLVTKGIGSGIFMLLAIFFGLNIVEFDLTLAMVGNLLALFFIGITTFLLVWDLEKPLMFLTIITRPQWKSWLTRGAFILMGFSAVAGLWFLAEWGGFSGVRGLLLFLGFGLAVASAIYTAFLFGQAEGRDLWQSTLLPAHLVIQALLAGSGVLLLLGIFITLSAAMATALGWVFAVSLVVDLGVILLGEFGMPHASDVAAKAAHEISHGRYSRHFWWGAIALGHLLPLALIWLFGMSSAIVASVGVLAVIAGLYLFEYAFILAPQEIPNS